MKKLIVAFVLMLVGITSAYADKSTCVKGAQYVHSIGILRDAGAPIEEVKQTVAANIGSDKLLIQIIDIVYNNVELEPMYLARDFYAYCMKQDVNES